MAKLSKGERDYRFRTRMVDALDGNLRLLIKWGALAFIAWRSGIALTALAGSQTLADFRFSVFGNVTIDKYLGHVLLVVFGGGGIGYGYNQGRLRRKDVLRMGNRIKDLENHIDPMRSSSKLTKSGTTRPEDSL